MGLAWGTMCPQSKSSSSKSAPSRLSRAASSWSLTYAGDARTARTSVVAVPTGGSTMSRASSLQ
ncbi:Uncharacterised protein [Mycobacterium tuberculosis]|nr:Uncharacterised protein [Mycobacterium tuberculosis]